MKNVKYIITRLLYVYSIQGKNILQILMWVILLVNFKIDSNKYAYCMYSDEVCFENPGVYL